MIASTAGWISCVGLISLVGANLFVRRGAGSALGVAVALSFAVPVWLEVPIFGIPVGVRTFVSLLALLAFTVRSPRAIWSPLTLLDVVMAGMVIVHVASDAFHGWNVALASLRAYGEWAVPYVAGRYAVQLIRDVEPLAACVTGIVILLGLGGLVEMLSGVNLWEVVFGNRPLEGVPRDADRFGLKRAFGTTLHPIYFGLLILMLSPWPVALLKWGQAPWQRRLALSGLAACAGGTCSSLSRGPVVGGAVLVGLLGAVWSRWWRWTLVVASTAFLIWVAVDFRSFVSHLEWMGGEQSRVTKLKLDGEAVELSSFRHRLLLFQVYWPAMWKAGWLGYGTNAMLEFPPRVPFLPADAQTRERLKYVDNSYVFYVLRFGWAGAVIFTSACGAAALTGIRLAWDRSIGVLASSLAVMVVAVAVSLTTVWFSYNMGFELLWSYGVISGLASQQASQR